ncbi:MAG: putative ABC transporter ATP-binding protein YxlF [Candidatus Heimdallarchaeota archaeon LC_3]|nr:MAG: putative ABC transporter ATP-binding protein YxlF [Candidatus Heimdallarchaeota archaeon LC_3]
MTQHNSYVIQTQGLTKTYSGVPVLNSLDLNVTKGSIFGFLGPNGAGKTTTMKLLLGLITPSSGSGTIFGSDITRSSIKIRSKVGYLAQHPRYPSYMSSREVLRYTLKFYYKGPNHAIEERIDNMINLVGLEDKADRPIKGFSGGEIQRLGIAQANANYPDLLILDEPAASLDPLGRRDVLEIMERLKAHEVTVFYSTHILDDVERVSDTVTILNKGQLIAQGSIKEIMGGQEGIVYSVKFEGEGSTVEKQISDQSWVTEVEAKVEENSTLFYVHVSDEQVAKTKLLRLFLTDETINILEFGIKRYDLEEAFIKLVKGE